MTFGFQFDEEVFPDEGSLDHRVLVEARGSLSLAGGSLGLFFLLLLAGDLGGEGSVLQLEASQRVFEVHLAGGMVALELQSRRGLRG